MSKNNWQHRGQTNRSLFWPLALIILGLVLTISGSGVPDEPYAGQAEWYDEQGWDEEDKDD